MPVYRGAPNVDQWTPDAQSIIRVDDFSSPKELAVYLNMLDKNDTAYLQYTRFKTEGVTNPAVVELAKRSMADVKRFKTQDMQAQDRAQHSASDHYGICKLCDKLAGHAEQDPSGRQFTSGDPAWMAKGGILNREKFMPCAHARETSRDRLMQHNKKKFDEKAQAIHDKIWYQRSLADAQM